MTDAVKHTNTLDLLAFDLGASNGRGILGHFDGERIALTSAGHFENNFIPEGELGYWDLPHILGQMKLCFQKAKALGHAPACFGIDTWGVDYGLLDAEGQLIENPRAYRVSTDREMEAAWQKISKRQLFDLSGIAALNFNTVYQLYRRVLADDPALRKAHTLLLMPDLLGYLLTGEKRSEYTMATTTGLLDVHTQDWSADIMQALSIPQGIFTQIDRAGTLRGTMTRQVAEALGVDAVPFAAVGTHDTASAVAAIPGKGNFAFCSSGTWSLFGVETEKPVLNEFVFASNFSNEGTVQGGYRPLKNIMGLWIIQECRREWTRQGTPYSWDQIVALAREAEPLRSVVDPDDGPFFQAGAMPEKIRAYCRRTGQPVPETVGQIARTVYESLALKYRWALERLGEMRGQPIESLNIVGGGIQNQLLNQMAADSTGLVTTVGPTEGAVLGNLLMQLVALGQLSGIGQAREVAKASVETHQYQPNRSQAWEDAYGRLLKYMEE